MISFEINEMTMTTTKTVKKSRTEVTTKIEIEATNQFTGEICTAEGYSEFDGTTGIVVAELRAEQNLLANEMEKYMRFITKPYVNPTEEYYNKCFDELLEIHTDYLEVREKLNNVFED